MSKRSRAEQATFLVMLLARLLLFLWLLERPGWQNFVIGMTLLDVSELRYREWKDHG